MAHSGFYRRQTLHAGIMAWRTLLKQAKPDLVVALTYDGTAAPRVSAKGRGALAEEKGVVVVARQAYSHSASVGSR